MGIGERITGLLIAPVAVALVGLASNADDAFAAAETATSTSGSFRNYALIFFAVSFSVTVLLGLIGWRTRNRIGSDDRPMFDDPDAPIRIDDWRARK